MTVLQDEGVNGIPTDTRDERLKRLYELGTERGQQPVQGEPGVSHEAVDGGEQVALQV